MSDLISRADAIDALSRSSVYAWSTEQDLVAHSWAIRILQSLPSADAVHGEWIDTEFLKLKECSCCHNRWGVYSIEEFDFCPSCGARMKGGAE